MKSRGVYSLGTYGLRAYRLTQRSSDHAFHTSHGLQTLHALHSLHSYIHTYMHNMHTCMPCIHALHTYIARIHAYLHRHTYVHTHAYTQALLVFLDPDTGRFVWRALSGSACSVAPARLPSLVNSALSTRMLSCWYRSRERTTWLLLPSARSKVKVAEFPSSVMLTRAPVTPGPMTSLE